MLNGTGILSTPPSAPTLGSVVPGGGSVTLIFTAPVSNGGTTLTGYTATCTANGQTTRTATGTGSPLTVVGLVGGVSYSCSLTATNAGGSTSIASAVLLVTPSNGLDMSTIFFMLLS